MSSPLLYFAYGSNMSSRRIEARLGACRELGVTCLKGYCLRFHKRGRDASGKCNIHYTGDGRRHVYGGLYQLHESQAWRLDEFEGHGYARQRVTVLYQKQLREAYTYVALSQWIDETLRPFDWYRALVIQGAFDQGLPAAYVRRLSATRCKIDPDPVRRQTNMLLLTSIEDL